MRSAVWALILRYGERPAWVDLIVHHDVEDRAAVGPGFRCVLE
jgi:hypothetical protein